MEPGIVCREKNALLARAVLSPVDAMAFAFEHQFTFVINISEANKTFSLVK